MQCYAVYCSEHCLEWLFACEYHMCVRALGCVYACMYICMCVRLCFCIYVCMYVCMCLHVYVFVRVWICVRVRVSVFLYVCVYACSCALKRETEAECEREWPREETQDCVCLLDCDYVCVWATLRYSKSLQMHANPNTHRLFINRHLRVSEYRYTHVWACVFVCVYVCLHVCACALESQRERER